MANTSPANIGGSQTRLVTLDTTETDIILGAGTGNTICSAILQISGLTAGGGNIVPQARLVGASAESVAFMSVAYENLTTGAEVAVGTAITTDGLYAVRLDHGMELAIDYTDVSGTVKVLYSLGLG